MLERDGQRLLEQLDYIKTYKAGKMQALEEIIKIKEKISTYWNRNCSILPPLKADIFQFQKKEIDELRIELIVTDWLFFLNFASYIRHELKFESFREVVGLKDKELIVINFHFFNMEVPVIMDLSIKILGGNFTDEKLADENRSESALDKLFSLAPAVITIWPAAEAALKKLESWWYRLGSKKHTSIPVANIVSSNNLANEVLINENIVNQTSFSNKLSSPNTFMYGDNGFTSLACEGNLPISWSLIGETVQAVKLHTEHLMDGYGWSWEAYWEEKSLSELIASLPRYNCNYPFSTTLVGCMGVEKMLKVIAPPRAQACRMILGEWERIKCHLWWLTNFTRSAGVHLYHSWLDQAYQEVELPFTSLVQKMPVTSLLCIGGLLIPLDGEWLTLNIKIVRKITAELNILHKFLTRSSNWKSLTREVLISRKDAILYGCSGPLLRSTGVNFDWRKNHGYYFYNDLEFEVPLGVSGNIFDLYLVRVEEIRQSLNIISRLVHDMPSGEVLDKKIDHNFNDRNNYLSININGEDRKILSKVMATIEAPNGELGIFINSQPYRVKLRSPSEYLLNYWSKIVPGKSLETAEIIFNSLNIIPEELS